ncbi:hypothetical protein AMK06_CH02012 [Rhizobium sp. N541]|uniref:hypothetical protein n=1 Tax=unclassified Rhizobium TaxID=2613769 RepID=UPI0007EE8614|nr:MULTISPECIES: hypothetical protein [unclassified Rhizobium]ANM16912.1 hypothetical protein AMK06_CH02012 [Rhizobium sp. N541]ANM23297.1 hypothetical protein AMK07_CH02009 [Rhizobium sp. N941]
MTTGEEIFWGNARSVLRDIDMQHLDLAHGAAVEIVRWCLVVHGRPTHHRQTFLEQESPTLLAYLEKLASSGDAAGWRALRDRVQLHAELLRETGMQPCAKPWLAAIWHTLPELAAIGQGILDDREEPRSVADFEAAPVSPDADASSGGGGDDKGSADKSGAAGTTAKPKPSPRLALPVVSVVLTEADKKALDLDKRSSDADAKNDATPERPDGADVPTGPKIPGGPK